MSRFWKTVTSAMRSLTNVSAQATPANPELVCTGRQAVRTTPEIRLVVVHNSNKNKNAYQHCVTLRLTV